MRCACGVEIDPDVADGFAFLVRRQFPESLGRDGLLTKAVVDRLLLCNGCETAVVSVLRKRARLRARGELGGEQTTSSPAKSVAWTPSKELMDSLAKTVVVDSRGDPALGVSDEDFIEGLKSLE